MSTTRWIIETECEHGYIGLAKHARVPGGCSGGSRIVVDPANPPPERVQRAAKAIDDEIGDELRDHLGHIMRKWPNTVTYLAEAALTAFLSDPEHGTEG